jgi:hypothetical protein
MQYVLCLASSVVEAATAAATACALRVGSVTIWSLFEQL